jgi:hypothetical protein
LEAIASRTSMRSSLFSVLLHGTPPCAALCGRVSWRCSIVPLSRRAKASYPSFYKALYTASLQTLLKIGEESALQAMLSPIVCAPIFIPAGGQCPGTTVVEQ